jgi:hypothetical protein
VILVIGSSINSVAKELSSQSSWIEDPKILAENLPRNEKASYC